MPEKAENFPEKSLAIQKKMCYNTKASAGIVPAGEKGGPLPRF